MKVYRREHEGPLSPVLRAITSEAKECYDQRNEDRGCSADLACRWWGRRGGLRSLLAEPAVQCCVFYVCTHEVVAFHFGRELRCWRGGGQHWGRGTRAAPHDADPEFHVDGSWMTCTVPVGRVKSAII